MAAHEDHDAAEALAAWDELLHRTTLQTVRALNYSTEAHTLTTISLLSLTDTLDSSTDASVAPPEVKIRRGPGRPRLKPSGPANQGNRVTHKYRKPIGPLVVPLGSSPAPTPTPGRSPAMSPVPSPSPSLHDRGTGFYPPPAHHD